MKIPTYDTPQVQAQAIDIPKRNPNAARGAFGEALGQGLQQVGSDVFRMVQDIQKTQHDKAVNDVLALDGRLTTDAKSKQGEQWTKPVNGKLPMETMLEDRKRQIADLVKDLPNHVKVQVTQAADRSLITLRRTFDNHLLQEGERLKDANAQASVENLGTYVQSHPWDEAGAADRLAVALNANAPKFAGMPEAQKRFEANLVATTLIARTRGMMESDPKAAKDFFDKNAEAMSASAHFADTKKLVESKAKESNVLAWVDARYQPGMNIAQFDKELVATFTTQEERRAARAEWGDREQAHKADLKNKVTAQVSEVWKAEMKGAPLRQLFAQIDQAPDLNDTERKELKEQVERERKGDPEDRRLARLGALMPYLMAPDQVAKMTPNQIWAERGKLGAEGVEYLIHWQQRLGSQEQKVADATIDPHTVKGVRDSMKLGDKAHNGMVERAVMQAQQQVYEEQAALGAGKKLSPQRKEEILRLQLAPVQIELPRSSWSPLKWLGDDSYTQDTRFMDVENPNDVIAGFPVAERAAAESEYRTRTGLPPGAPIPPGSLAQYLILRRQKQGAK